MKTLTWWIAAGAVALMFPGTAHAAQGDWQVVARCEADSTIISVTNVSQVAGHVLVEGGADGAVAAGETKEFPATDTGLQLPSVGLIGAGDGQITVAGFFAAEQPDTYNVTLCVATTTTPTTTPATVATPLPRTGGGGRDLVALAAVTLFAGLGVSLAARRP